MLADWRQETGAKEKEKLLRYVRKDRYPSMGLFATMVPTASKEFLYHIRVERTFEGVLMEKPFYVNITQDTPHTIEQIEIEAWERSFRQSPPREGEERKFVVETAFHRAEE